MNYIPNYLRAFAPQRSRQTRRGNLFTMIELLLVMVVLSILVAMMIPAFERIALGGGVDGAARSVGAQLRMARQYAIANRLHVALVMPGDEIGDTEKSYTAYRAGIVETTGAATVNFDEWAANTEWQYVPTGSIIHEVGTGRTVNNVDIGGTNENNVRAIVFAPSGRVLGNDQTVKVIEGAVGPDGNAVVRNPDNYIELLIDTYTGRVSYKEREDD